MPDISPYNSEYFIRYTLNETKPAKDGAGHAIDNTVEKHTPGITDRKPDKLSIDSTKNEENNNSYELTDLEKKQVEQLKSTDSKVRAHEMAHIAAGGGLVRGGATFSYTTGPDGKQYATGGEVKIDTSYERGDPSATIMKMQRVRRAAMAPANPSGQDRAVASRATSIENQARSEKIKENAGSTSDTAKTFMEAYEKAEMPDQNEAGKIVDVEK